MLFGDLVGDLCVFIVESLNICMFNCLLTYQIIQEKLVNCLKK